MALVVGIGNPTRGDDGAGPLVAARVRARARRSDDVEVLAVQQLTPEVAERVAAHDVVVFVDASLRTERVRVEAVADAAVTAAGGGSHRGTPEEIVAIARALYGARPRVCACVEIPGREFGFGEGLSRGCTRAVAEAVEAVEQVLRR